MKQRVGATTPGNSPGQRGRSRRRAFGECMAAPLGSTILTLMTIIAGLMGTLFQPEIKGSIPFTWGLTLAGFGFWALATITGLAYFFRQEAVAKTRSELTQNLEQRIGQVQRVLRTIPPENFLDQYAAFHLAADIATQAAIEIPKGTAGRDAELGKAVRCCLTALAVLAKQFDGDREQAYAANMMVFYSRESLEANDSLREAVIDKAEFLKPELWGMEALAGVLHLAPAFSTTAVIGKEELQPETDVVDTACDPLIEPLTLPVLKSPESAERRRVLPGAPWVFSTGAPQDVIEDTQQFSAWCNKHADFDQQYINLIEGYFARNTQIRSFVSMPIIPMTGGTPVAAVSVHSANPGLLRGDADGRRLFRPMVAPFLNKIARLYQHLELGGTLERYDQIAPGDTGVAPSGPAD